MFGVGETLVRRCSCEAKLSISRIDHGSKIGGQQKYAFGAGETFVFAKSIFRDRAISHPRSAPGDLGVRLGSAIGHPQAAWLDLARLGLGLIFKVGVWCWRDVAFHKKGVFT